jgi:hypothetical protein
MQADPAAGPDSRRGLQPQPDDPRALRRKQQDDSAWLLLLERNVYYGVCGGKLTGRIQKQASRNRLAYRHVDSPVPESCRGRTHERDALQRAVFDVLLGVEVAAELRPDYYNNVWGDDPRATFKAEVQERTVELRKRIDEIEQELRPVREQVLQAVVDGKTIGRDHLDTFMPGAAALAVESERLRRQLDRLDAVQQHRLRRRFTGAVSSAEMLNEFERLLTEDDGSPEFLIRRQAAVRAAVDCVIVHTREENGERITEIEVVGPVLPDNAPPLRPVVPHRSAARALCFAPLDDTVPGAIRRRRRDARTVHQDYSWWTVRTAEVPVVAWASGRLALTAGRGSGKRR